MTARSCVGHVTAYTVLLLRPDLWDGTPRDWTYQAHVIAPDVAGAEKAARQQAAAADGDVNAAGYDVLAVYSGHLTDVARTDSARELP